MSRKPDDELLALFEHTPPPSLSLDFNRRLRLGVAAERQRRRSWRWRLVAMQAYWLAAAAASLWVLDRLQWPQTASLGLWPVTLGVLLVLAAAPVLVLLRGLRTDLFELVCGSLEGLTGGGRGGGSTSASVML